MTCFKLYARRGTVPASVDKVADPWTTFQMTLREPGPIPPAFDFTRFLVSSITFMTHLSEVSVFFDDKCLVKLSKACGVPKEVPMLKGLKATSHEGMMNVKSIQTMREFYPRSGRIHLYPFFDSSSHRGGGGSMGIHCWLRKAFRCIKDCRTKDSVSSSQWIFLVTFRWVRRFLNTTENANAGARGAQRVDQPFRGTLVERRIDYLRCKCRCTTQ